MLNDRRFSVTKKTSKFCFSRAKNAEFKTDSGKRNWLKTRDLGLHKATNGEYEAWVSRTNTIGGTTGRHCHNYDFQIMFVVKGWLKMYHEEHGEVLMEEGDFVYHPKGHIHDIIEYSQNMELFEVCSPAGRHSIDLQ